MGWLCMRPWNFCVLGRELIPCGAGHVQGPMNLHGLEKDIDVMIEAKCKERALLRFRALSAAPPSADAVMAGKLLDL